MSKGIKRTDLRACHFCGKGLLHNMSPICYRFTVEQHVFNPTEINRHAGMDLHFGNQHPALSVALLGDSEFTAVASVASGLICSDCAMDPRRMFAETLEEPAPNLTQGAQKPNGN